MSQNFKCDICGAPATVHLTQIINGKVQKIHLCEHCAGKKIGEDDMFPPLMKVMETIAKKYASAKGKLSERKDGQEVDDTASPDEKRCPKCGMTASLFEKDNRLGCPNCYDVFSEKIDALLPEIQGGKNYVGNAKGKISAGTQSDEKKSVEELRARLKKAVAEEDFLLAANLRDQLRALEKKSVPAKKSSTAKAKKKPASRVAKPRSRKKSSSEREEKS